MDSRSISTVSAVSGLALATKTAAVGSAASSIVATTGGVGLVTAGGAVAVAVAAPVAICLGVLGFLAVLARND